MKSIKLKQNALLFIAALIFFAFNITSSSAQNIEIPKVKDKDLQNALSYCEKEDYKTAKTLIDNIISKDDKNADAHYALAIVLSKLKKIDDAINENKRAIELDAKNADYHFVLSMLHAIEVNTASVFRMISIVKSIKAELILALEIDPNHKQAMITLTGFYTEAPSIVGGDIEKALELANKLLKLDEKQARKFLVQIYTSMNNKAKAAEEIENLIKIDEYSGRYLLAQELEKQEDLSKAEEQYKIIENKFGNNSEYSAFFNNYGYFLLKQKRFDEAIEKFKKQVQLAPKSANAHDSLGEGYFNKNMLKESLAEYTKALELNPDLKSAKDKIKEIKELMNN